MKESGPLSRRSGMNKLPLLIAMLALAACASSGVKVDQAKVEALQKGRTTYDEVIRDFGPPTGRTISANGDKILTYSYFSIQTRPENFIPVVGLFVGGADHELSMVMLTFDQNNILSNYTSTSGGTGTGRNLSGISQERKEVREVK